MSEFDLKAGEMRYLRPKGDKVQIAQAERGRAVQNLLIP